MHWERKVIWWAGKGEIHWQWRTCRICIGFKHMKYTKGIKTTKKASGWSYPSDGSVLKDKKERELVKHGKGHWGLKYRVTTDGEIKEKNTQQKDRCRSGWSKPSEVQSASVSHQHIIEVEAMWTPEIGHGETRAKQGHVGGGGGGSTGWGVERVS